MWFGKVFRTDTYNVGTVSTLKVPTFLCDAFSDTSQASQT